MRGRCSTSGLVPSSTDSQSPYMDRPRVGDVRLVDWCTQSTDLESLKNKELFTIAPVEGPRVGGVGLVDWSICTPTCRALKQNSGLIFFHQKKYCCFYPHWLRDSVSSVCRIFYELSLKHQRFFSPQHLINQGNISIYSPLKCNVSSHKSIFFYLIGET